MIDNRPRHMAAAQSAYAALIGNHRLALSGSDAVTRHQVSFAAHGSRYNSRSATVPRIVTARAVGVPPARPLPVKRIKRLGGLADAASLGFDA